MDIVVGFVRTAEGHAALERGIEEALLRSARLIVVNSSKGNDYERAEDVIATREELERVNAKLTAAGVDHDIRELARGRTPAEDIVAIANEVVAGMIVIGLRRRSRVGKFLLGSDAQDVLLQADCVVLAVKPGPEAEIAP